MSSGDEPSNANEGSSDIQGPVSRDEIGSFSVSTDDLSALTNEERKTTASSTTETDANTNRDESETASDDRKPSPKQESESEESDGQVTSDNDINLQSSNPSTQNQEPFPEILMRMLNTEAEAGRESIKWLPDGSGFEVIDQNALEKDILPIYFPSSHTTLFQSFVRRLYRWSFLQIGKRKSGHYIFANDCFHRDNDLYKQLKAKPRPRGYIRQVKLSTTGTTQEVSNEPMASISQRIDAGISSHDCSSLPTNPSLGFSSQLAQAQKDITSQLNSIIFSYSNNPMMLSSLQNVFSNVLNNQLTFGVPQNRPHDSTPQQMPNLSNQTQPVHAGTQNQAQIPGNQIVDNVLRFLTQGQPPGTAYSSATSLQQHHMHSAFQYAPPILPAMQQQHAPPILPAMQQQGAGSVIQGQHPNNEYEGSQHNADTATTNTSVSLLGAQPKNDNETSESGTNDRKRRRSPSPKDNC